jgi:hypothetical protein
VFDRALAHSAHNLLKHEVDWRLLKSKEESRNVKAKLPCGLRRKQSGEITEIQMIH